MDMVEQRKLDTRWPLRVYRLEHIRLSQLLDALLGEVVKLAPADLQPQRLIELIEHEKTIKDVIEHHQEREERDLFTEYRYALDR